MLEHWSGWRGWDSTDFQDAVISSQEKEIKRLKAFTFSLTEKKKKLITMDLMNSVIFCAKISH